jgi:HIRAN domain
VKTALAKIDPTMLALMHGSFQKDDKLMPFAREVLLTECHVSGTVHKELKTIEPGLKSGAVLTLRREPDNAHDSLAIRVYDAVGNALGYIPRITNAPLARLMDAGKQLFARLEAKEWHGDWLKIDIGVYLRDF